LELTEARIGEGSESGDSRMGWREVGDAAREVLWECRDLGELQVPGSPYTGLTLPKDVTYLAPMNKSSEEPLGRIGYLLSRYPAVSHTFFLKEVLGLRERGISVETASINLPDRPAGGLSEAELAESRQTFYVKGGGTASAMVRVAGVAIRHPVVTLRGLGYALRMGRWSAINQVYALFYLAEALLAGQWMRDRGIERLHVQFGGPVASVGLMTAKAWRVRWSMTLHGPDEFFDQEASYLRQKIESAEFVVCISDFCKSQVLRIAPEVEEGKLAVVRLGVDCEVLRPQAHGRAQAAGLEPVPVRLVCTGRMVAAKGHRTLLRAFAASAGKGWDLRLTLVGDGPERRALEGLADQLGIGPRVEFLGAMVHEATLEQVARADLFVLASFAEGLPVALMEAMALGIPCISTPIAAIPELIQDGRNGVLVPPANVEALSEAIERCAASAQLRWELGSAARATVEERYNLARNLDSLAGFWRHRLRAG
jgi:glycosyltransferase involved in cell wall biosynthesis